MDNGNRPYIIALDKKGSVASAMTPTAGLIIDIGGYGGNALDEHCEILTDFGSHPRYCHISTSEDNSGRQLDVLFCFDNNSQPNSLNGPAGVISGYFPAPFFMVSGSREIAIPEGVTYLHWKSLKSTSGHIVVEFRTT